MFIVPHLIGRAALSIGEPEPLVRTRRSRRAMRRVAGAPAHLREAASFVNALIDDGGYRRRTRPATPAADTTAQPANNPATVRPATRRPGLVRRVLWESEVSESTFANPLVRSLVGAGVIGGSVGFAYSILSTATGDFTDFSRLAEATLQLLDRQRWPETAELFGQAQYTAPRPEAIGVVTTTPRLSDTPAARE